MYTWVKSLENKILVPWLLLVAFVKRRTASLKADLKGNCIQQIRNGPKSCGKQWIGESLPISLTKDTPLSQGRKPSVSLPSDIS